MTQMKQYQKAASYILARTDSNPKIGLILGSGLGVLTEEIENAVKIPFEHIPFFTKPTAEGHKGELVIGKLGGVDVVALSGRYHYYEGLTLQQVTFPVRVMKLLGVERLILTNACGAVNESFKPGEIMLIEDHINLVSNNPLIGKNQDDFGPRFPDATEIYTKKLREIAIQEATLLNLKIQQGVYAWWTGPSYETPAEIKMIRRLGADAVGMSTVPEALVASHAGIEVLGLSCLTNMASGILPQKLSHQEVLDVALHVREKFSLLVKNIVKKI